MSNSFVTRNAPFGTGNTPNVRVKIVGGKRIHVIDDSNYSGGPFDGQRGEKEGGEQERSTPTHLPPMTAGTKTQVDRRPQIGGYTSKDDPFMAHTLQHRNDSSQLNPLNPLPPIQHPQGPPPQATWGAGHIAPAPRQPDILPRDPARLTRDEEAELMRRTWDDLRGYDAAKLKDLYMEISGGDPDLTGFVKFDDITFATLKHQVPISGQRLRQIAAMYVAQSGNGVIVNYEKVLSFISAALKGPPPVQQGPPPQQYPPRRDMRDVMDHYRDDDKRGVTHPLETNGEDGKLLRMIEASMTGHEEDFDVETLRQAFGIFDREKRGTLSADQIKLVCYKCRLPLQESVLEKVISRLPDHGQGQFEWEKFIRYLERVQPHKTGLNIPESRRPAEYARQMPQPGASWPHAQEVRNPFRPNMGIDQYDTNAASLAPRGRAAPKFAGVGALSPREPPIPRMPQMPKQLQDFNSRGPSPTKQPSPRAPPDPLQSHPRTEAVNDMEKERKKLGRIDAMETELRDLEEQYKRAKISAVQDQERKDQPWFQRYLKFAEALYNNDIDKTGKLPVADVRRLLDGYNLVYHLEIPTAHAEKLVMSMADNGEVDLDPFLKALSRPGGQPQNA